MKFKYYFFLLFFSTIYSFSQEQNQSFNSKRYIDSIFSVKAIEIEKNNYESLDKINKIKSDLIEKENSFWADEAFWMITILGGLLALTPLMFWIVEILKNKTFKRINRLERDIKNAQSIVSEYHAFQFYQEYYFEDVIKPTFEKITDILIDISKTKGLDEQVISEITEQFYDFERVVNLLHYDEDKKQQASRYIESRKSDFLKIKMNSILRKISSKNHKLVILELLNSYDK